ncbi:DUF1146 family protein [Paenibacillus thalictri]|uniref:DUF1146 domain-containing protein n=1 Tax=Paenibacillus thalictri TaxID=2527873 RepID=A0A4V2J3J7_9BACL|nr:DUF1146 family protein [Paenibacillus thalictri]TBL72967.1 DUF1146 domain-containing protein [Paenibacillus thalictri]
MGTDPFNATLGLEGLVNIFAVIVCIGLSWWGLQELRFDMLLRRPKSAAARLLQIFLSIALGYQVARFIIEYFHWSTWLHEMF